MESGEINVRIQAKVELSSPQKGYQERVEEAREMLVTYKVVLHVSSFFPQLCLQLLELILKDKEVASLFVEEMMERDERSYDISK
uniref:Uncharacterized protein n=1 Tax=Solanum lycopersicum TaxID=4081 RepID=K4BHI3_SOLLC